MNYQKQKGARRGLVQAEDELILILSQIYYQLCDCRRKYPELEDIIDLKFHLEDCPYYIRVKETGIEFNG